MQPVAWEYAVTALNLESLERFLWVVPLEPQETLHGTHSHPLSTHTRNIYTHSDAVYDPCGTYCLVPAAPPLRHRSRTPPSQASNSVLLWFCSFLLLFAAASHPVSILLVYYGYYLLMTLASAVAVAVAVNARSDSVIVVIIIVVGFYITLE